MPGFNGRMDDLEEALLNSNPSTSGRHNVVPILIPDEAPELDTWEDKALKAAQQEPDYRIDRGRGWYAAERERKQVPSLVQTGRHAGRSRVNVTGVEWKMLMRHKLKRDFFSTAVNSPLPQILGILVAAYVGSIALWSTIYYVLWWNNEECFTGFDGAISALLFAIETQQTIGYGTRAPGECWLTATFIGMHSLLTVVLDCVILGIAFARISHPKNRGRTILISDCAVIARRNGELKFMFRVGDLMVRQVVNPVVRAFLFTWGPGQTGRVTSEGERIPYTTQELELTGHDPTLLLPAIMEHTIEEYSPLFGHTQRSLEAISGEIVVLFSATTETGANFSIRHSYLPQEIHWGHVLVNIITPAGEGETRHKVDISRFHEVEPQMGMDMLPPHKLARKVILGGSRGALPAPLLGTNTLVLCDTGCVATRDGHRVLMFRVGDVYPGGQVLNIRIEAFLYRWQLRTTMEGELLPYSMQPLTLHPSKPSLRYPLVVWHALEAADSPLGHWHSVSDKRADADCEVLVVMRGVCGTSGKALMRQRVYPVLAGIKWGAVFCPLVEAPPPGMISMRARAGGPTIDWSAFHSTAPAPMEMAEARMQWQSSFGGGGSGCLPVQRRLSCTGGSGTMQQTLQTQPSYPPAPSQLQTQPPHPPSSSLQRQQSHPPATSLYASHAAPIPMPIHAPAIFEPTDAGTDIPQSLATWQPVDERALQGRGQGRSARGASAVPSLAQPQSMFSQQSQQQPLSQGPRVSQQQSQQQTGQPCGRAVGAQAQAQMQAYAARAHSSGQLPQSGHAQGTNRRTATGTSPILSAENTMMTSECTTSSDPKDKSWHNTRSLFAAMEELAKLSAEEQQGKQ